MHRLDHVLYTTCIQYVNNYFPDQIIQFELYILRLIADIAEKQIIRSPYYTLCRPMLASRKWFCFTVGKGVIYAVPLPLTMKYNRLIAKYSSDFLRNIQNNGYTGV